MQLINDTQRLQWAEKISEASDRINSLSVRERGIITCAVVLVMLMLHQVLWTDRVAAEKKIQQAEITRLQKQIETLQQQSLSILNAYQQDPNAPLREQLAALEGDIDQIHQQIAAYEEGLVSPEKMKALLAGLTDRTVNTEILSVETLPVTVIEIETGRSGSGGKHLTGNDVQDSSDEISGQPVQLWRHGMKVTLKVNFASAVEYLEKLEALPWYLYWETLDYQVDNYPEASLTLQLYTLSTDDVWIRL